METKYYVEKLTDLIKLINGSIISSLLDKEETPLIYVKGEKEYLLFKPVNTKYKKIPFLAPSRFLFSTKHILVLQNKYLEIIDYDTKENLFTKEEFNLLRNKGAGLTTYEMPPFNFSINLYFNDLLKYINLVEPNSIEVEKQQTAITNEINRILTDYKGEFKMYDTGSTGRCTNVPNETNEKWDFDYIIKTNEENIEPIKQLLLNKLNVKNKETDYLKIADYRIRLTNVLIKKLLEPVDIDISFTRVTEDYLSTDESLKERLKNIDKLDHSKCKLVIANIMYAKALLKSKNVYKAAKSLKGEDKINGSFGGVGIENWILQYGGSLIDASLDFLAKSKGLTFAEFEQIYSVMDYGMNHVTVARGGYPYDNFVMKNMREEGYNKLKEVLNEFINENY